MNTIFMTSGLNKALNLVSEIGSLQKEAEIIGSAAFLNLHLDSRDEVVKVYRASPSTSYTFYDMEKETIENIKSKIIDIINAKVEALKKNLSEIACIAINVGE